MRLELAVSRSEPITAPSPDAHLVHRAQAGDGAAFGELVRRHLRQAHAVAHSIVHDHTDAEDVCQDAFVAALDHIADCHPAGNFRVWLWQIVRRRALDLLRRRRVRAAAVRGTARGEVEVAAPEREGPGAHAERAELRSRLTAVLDTLPETQRQVLLLHDVHGWVHHEIGALLGFTEGTSRSHLSHARRRARQALGGELAALAS